MPASIELSIKLVVCLKRSATYFLARPHCQAAFTGGSGWGGAGSAGLAGWTGHKGRERPAASHRLVLLGSAPKCGSDGPGPGAVRERGQSRQSRQSRQCAAGHGTVTAESQVRVTSGCAGRPGLCSLHSKWGRPGLGVVADSPPPESPVCCGTAAGCELAPEAGFGGERHGPPPPGPTTL